MISYDIGTSSFFQKSNEDMIVTFEGILKAKTPLNNGYYHLDWLYRLTNGTYCSTFLPSMHFISQVIRKPFCICAHKGADQLSCARAADQHFFVFATQIVQSFLFLNSKLRASDHLLLIQSSVCVSSGREPRR